MTHERHKRNLKNQVIRTEGIMILQKKMNREDANR